MEPDRVLAAFDAEVRRSVRPDGSGARIEADPLMVRWVRADGHVWDRRRAGDRTTGSRTAPGRVDSRVS